MQFCLFCCNFFNFQCAEFKDFYVFTTACDRITKRRGSSTAVAKRVTAGCDTRWQGKVKMFLRQADELKQNVAAAREIFTSERLAAIVEDSSLFFCKCNCTDGVV